MKLTILVDNKAKEGLEHEHGLSFLIETEDHRILFDTGKGTALQANAELLGIGLSDLDAVVLSHGHYDHTGGIPYVLTQAPQVPVYCHPAAFRTRFTVRGEEARPISMVPEVKALLESRSPDLLHLITEPTTLFSDIGITGAIPRIEAWENTGGPFFKDIQGTIADPIEDDMAIWIQTTYGLVVVVGCCHAGLSNTLRHIRSYRPDDAIRAVIGGFHLLEASDERLQRTISTLETLSPARIIPCHCTGARQTAALQQSLGGCVTEGRAGEIFRF